MIKRIAVIWLLSISSTAFAIEPHILPNNLKVELTPGTELFILEQKLLNNSSDIFARIVTGPNEGNDVRLSINSEDSIGKFFSQTPWDHLAIPTIRLDDAFYIHLYRPTTGVVDASSLIEKNQYSESLRQRMGKFLFTNLANYLPLTNHQNTDLATDSHLSCPAIPQEQNGTPCHTIAAAKLPTELITLISHESKLGGEDPALVSAILQNESNFDPFIENLYEKALCHEASGCGTYRWGKGLAQLGATNAATYGLDWSFEIPKPDACKKTTLLHSLCLTELAKICKAYENLALKPIQCPQFAIRAIVLKLHSEINPSPMGQIKTIDKESLLNVDIGTYLEQTPAEKVRSKISIYNRGPRVINSYVEYFEQNRRFPKSYGEAWTTVRNSETPSTEMGYEILSHEYVNRCYVWAVAGICGEIPSFSVLAQFQTQFEIQTH